MKKKLGLCIPLAKEDYELVEQYCDIIPSGDLKTGIYGLAEEEVYEDLKGCEIVVTMSEKTGKETINRWADQGLKFLIAARGTPTMTDWQACHDRKIPLGHTPGRNAIAVAEFTMMLMLMLTKKVHPILNRMHDGMYLGEAKEDVFDYVERQDINWPHGENSPFGDFGYNHELYDKKLGIVGFGAIGRKVAALAKAFGMEVLATDAYCGDDIIREAGVQPCDVKTLLRESDIVSIHLPVTDETRFMVDETWFAQMKPTALVINTARAAVIKQKAFVDAVVNQKIAGAAMDVCWEEPIPRNHPFMHMDNVIVTPHMAAMTEEIDHYWTSKLVTEHIVNYCEGKPLKNLWTRLDQPGKE